MRMFNAPARLMRRATHMETPFMLDAILVTVGIAAVACSLFYKFLLLLYQADQRAAARRREHGPHGGAPGGL